jgi:hypothetical protein
MRGWTRLALVSGLLAAGAAHGQTVTDGNSSFGQVAANTIGAAIRTGANGGTNGVFTAGGDATDQLFQQWWWYRVEGVNAREFALSNRTSNTAVGNQLIYEFVEPEGFNFRVTYRLTDGADAPASANVDARVEISNTMNHAMSLALFSYLDYDLEGLATDRAELAEPGRILITDNTSGFFGQFLAENPTAYGVGAFATIRNELTDTGVDNFASTGLPFAPADWSGAFQWNLNVPANGTVTVRCAFSLNMAASLGDVGCDSIDFNGDGLFPDNLDLVDFVTVFGGGACSNDPNCNDIDFNNDGLFPDNEDIFALFRVFGGGDC